MRKKCSMASGRLTNAQPTDSKNEKFRPANYETTSTTTMCRRFSPACKRHKNSEKRHMRRGRQHTNTEKTMFRKLLIMTDDFARHATRERKRKRERERDRRRKREREKDRERDQRKRNRERGKQSNPDVPAKRERAIYSSRSNRAKNNPVNDLMRPNCVPIAL